MLNNDEPYSTENHLFYKAMLHVHTLASTIYNAHAVAIDC